MSTPHRGQSSDPEPVALYPSPPVTARSGGNGYHTRRFRDVEVARRSDVVPRQRENGGKAHYTTLRV